MSIYLSRETLCSLPDHVSRPQYKYNDLEPGIIHIGYGIFTGLVSGNRCKKVLNLLDLRKSF